jgi:protein-tyrosine phosphatase
MRILMVCLGNICRSPMAEGVLKAALDQRYVKHQVMVDSCGFEAFHLGERPHSMAIATAQRHGVDISQQRQRLFEPADFDRFDRIYVMDNGNYAQVRAMSRTAEDMQKVDYLMNVIHPGSNRIVPDPWGGTGKDYEYSFSLIEQACQKIVAMLDSTFFNT